MKVDQEVEIFRSRLKSRLSRPESGLGRLKSRLSRLESRPRSRNF